MRITEFFDELTRQYSLSSDREIARLLGLTSGRISQLRKRDGALSAKQIVSFFKKAEKNSCKVAFSKSIRAVVEMYPIEATSSKQDKKWEILPTGAEFPRNQAIRKHLEQCQGIYLLYDSQGCAIYAGKTERQNLWKEITNAFNRARSNHQAFFVSHPETGKSFFPAWEKPRQPSKRQIYLHDTAHYFSAFEVDPRLTAKLEAFVVRAFCNSLSNKKMERL